MLSRLRYLIRDYFGFNKSETNGFLVLLLALILLVFWRFLLDWILPISLIEDTILADAKRLDSLQQMLSLEDSKPKYQQHRFASAYTNNYAKYSKTSHVKNFDIQLFNFNPNTISVDEWQQLGIQKWLADRILKYREKGGKFKKKQDLLRIYNFPENVFANIEPYIQLPDADESYNQPFEQSHKTIASNINMLPTEKPKVVYRPYLIELNTADTTEFKRVRGIGSKLSTRIVNYRTNLGGFYSMEQIREVFGLDSAVVEELVQRSTLNNTQLSKINVNTATADALKTHPYIGYRLAQVLVNYRNQHGNYTNENDLLKIRILDPSKLVKLRPYLAY